MWAQEKSNAENELCQPVEVQGEWKIAPECEPYFMRTFDEFLLEGQVHSLSPSVIGARYGGMHC